MNRPRPKVAALVPFWEFWQTSTDEDLRSRAEAVAGMAAAVLPEVDIVESQVLSAATAAADVAQRVEASGADVLLVLQLMAVPPATTTRILDLLPGLPVVVWALDLREPFAGTSSHADITSSGATVGTTQLVSMLVRTARPLSLTIGRLHEEQETGAVHRSIRAAWASRRIASGTLARIGPEPRGYDCVVCDVAELTSAIGIRVVDIAPAALAERYHRTSPGAIEAVAAEAAETFELREDTAPTPEGLARSLRFAAALESLDDELAVDAGAINCHLPELRFSADVGIAPCFALGRETTRGRPWACAGDMLTAVALLTTKLLGGAALYHELESIDFERDQLVIANTGEHDLAWADPRHTPVLRANGWFASDPVCGACACFSPPPGPATLVAFVPNPAALNRTEPSGFRYIVAEGEFGECTHPESGTPNASFRFRGRSAPDGFRAWALAGANHHSSSTPGHFGDSVEQVARYLGVGCVRVS